jgi:hypothetical protein
LAFLGLLFYGCSKLIPDDPDAGQKKTSSVASLAQAKKPALALPQSKQPAAPIVAYKGYPLTADELFSAYDRNEVSADDLYKDRLLLITGRVGSINKDFTNSIYIEFPSRSNQFEGVHATLLESEKYRAAYVAKGEKLTLSCKGAGKIVTDVFVIDCKIQ